MPFNSHRLAGAYQGRQCPMTGLCKYRIHPRECQRQATEGELERREPRERQVGGQFQRGVPSGGPLSQAGEMRGGGNGLRMPLGGAEPLLQGPAGAVSWSQPG